MPDMLEKGVSIAIMLFLLSMISERFITWMKIYFGKRGRSLPGFSEKNEDLRSKPKTKEEAKVRELKTLGLNIVLSILIAIIAHASLFDILKAKTPYDALGWSKENMSGIKNFWDVLLMILGGILTGLFISLGSKFWHDLLDLLLYTKSLKEKMCREETYEVKTVDELTEFLSFSEADLVRLAIAQNEQALKAKFSNIEFLNDSIAVVDGERRDVLGIYLSDSNTNGLPDKIPVKLPSGKLYFVNTEIIVEVGAATVTSGMDGTVANADLFGFTGSACCIVSTTDKKDYLLTNCHVLTDGHLRNPLFKPGDHDVLYDDTKIGTWHFGCMNATGDFALAEIEDIDSFISKHSPEKFNKSPREIVKDDWLKLQVTVRGNKCGSVTDAFIIEVVQNQLKVKYKNGESITFNKAILIGNKPDKLKSKPVTNPGDSGGAVFDDKMNLIGIITAKGNNYTYAIPVTEFFATNNLELKQNL